MDSKDKPDDTIPRAAVIAITRGKLAWMLAMPWVSLVVAALVGAFWVDHQIERSERSVCPMYSAISPPSPSFTPSPGYFKDIVDRTGKLRKEKCE